jgi:hypothetical protein
MRQDAERIIAARSADSRWAQLLPIQSKMLRYSVLFFGGALLLEAIGYLVLTVVLP